MGPGVKKVQRTVSEVLVKNSSQLDLPEMDGSKYAIEKLNSTNYESWSFNVEMLLVREDLWKFVRSRAPDPVTEAWNQGDQKARATIALLVGPSQRRIIQRCNTSSETWDALERQFRTSSVTSVLAMLRKVINMQYQEGEDLEAHLNQMEDLFERIAKAGYEIPAKISMLMVLRSMPESYDNLGLALENKPENELTIEMVKIRLLDEAIKRSEGNHGNRSESLLRVQTSKPLLCYQCRQPGHRRRDCPAVKKEEEAKKLPRKPFKREFKPRARVATEENFAREKEFAFVTYSTKCATKSWIVDSGATSHMCGNLDFFDELVPESGMSVRVADGNMSEVKAKGTGKLVLCDAEGGKNIITLSGVLYVPGLESNLVSVSKLTEKGAEVEFSGSECLIWRNNELVATAFKSKGLYYFEETRVEVAANAHTEGCMFEWHRKLGHRDPEAIRRLVRESLADGIEITDCPCATNQPCECCLEGKMARLPFPKESGTSSNRVLDLVHSDICGPMNTVSSGGSRYFMTMIDDFSRYSAVYFLQRKSEAINVIKHYVRSVENRFGRKPVVIRSDQGGEYKSSELQRFYKEEGITPQYTTSYTPQQNGTAERKNRSLVEMARCLLLDSKLGYRYWAEAVNTANYLQNRLPTRSISKTPYEVWFGKVPRLEHLQLFGSPAFVHVPDQTRSKLEPKATKMILVGYSDQHKAYRFIDPVTDKFVVSRDARFLNSGSGIKLAQPSQIVEYFSPLAPNQEKETENPESLQTETELDPESTLIEEEPLDSSLDYISSEELQSPIQIRRSERSTKGVRPVRYSEYTNLVSKQIPEPRTYNEAVYGPEKELWLAAINDELQSLQQHQTWDIVDQPAGVNVIGSKWIFKRKEDEAGNVVRYKARLVAQGFTQKFGTDYDEVFAPVVKQVTLRILLTIAFQRKMILKHADVKTAYLNGELSETIYMRIPAGLPNNRDGTVCRLRRSLYGLKQSARVWNQTFDAALKKMHFQQSTNDSCLYFRGGTYLAIYVDDIVVACPSEEEYAEILCELNKSFVVTSLGDLRHFLGIEICRHEDGIALNQSRYISKLLKRFNLDNAKQSKIPLDPGHLQTKEESSKLPNNRDYASLIGGLLYVAVNTRPDIAVCVSILGRKVSCPTQADWVEAKRILRYLHFTIDHELLLGTTTQPLIVYVDADWAGDSKDRKSTSGFLVQLGGGTIFWCSKKQSCVTLSSTEAEYVALAECCQEIAWLLRLLGDFAVKVDLPLNVKEDNQSCIKQLIAPGIGRRSKHIETKHHFVREMQQNGTINTTYCPTGEMIADMLTKPLQATKLKQFREAASVLPSRRSVGDNGGKLSNRENNKQLKLP